MILNRDRQRYATAYEYDDSDPEITGRLIRIIRGLVDSNVGTDPDATTFNPGISGGDSVNPVVDQTTCEEFTYFGGAGNKAGLLQSTGMAYYASTDINSPPLIASIHLTEYDYDSSGRLSTVTRPKPQGAVDPVVTYTWANNRVSQIVDEVNELTSFAYDELGRLIRTQYNGSSEETWYDDDNLRIYNKDRNKIVSVRQWDSAARLDVSAQAYGTDSDLSDHSIESVQTDINNPFNVNPGMATVTRYTYLPGMNQPVQMSTNRKFTSFQYDHRGRTIQTRLSLGGANDYRQNATTWLQNRVFKVSQEMQNGNDLFIRNTYRGYSADGTNVRIMESRDNTFFSGGTVDNDTIINQPRPTDLSNNGLRIVDRITDSRGVTVRVVNERNIITDYEVDPLGRTTQQLDGRRDINQSIDDTYLTTTTTKYDFRSNPLESTSPLGNHTVMTYDAAGNLLERTDAEGQAGIQRVWSYAYDEKSRQKQETLPSGGINTRYYSDCCGRQNGFVNAEGDKRVTVLNAGGQVVFEAALNDSFANIETADYSQIGAAEKLSETTRRYDAAGRLQYQTRWRFAQGSFDPVTPPIAGLDSIAADQGVTTQYAFINQIPKTLLTGSGSTTAVVDIQSLSAGSSFTIDLNDAVDLLETNGVLLPSSRAGSASIVVAPDERTYSYSISDSLGRTVMNGLSYGPQATEGSPNDLINWSITKYDSSDSVDELPVEVVSTVNIEGFETRSLVDAYGWTVESQQVGQLVGGGDAVSSTEFDVSGNPLEVTDPNNNVTTYAYDPTGRQTSMTIDPGDLALTTSTEYFLEADADTSDPEPANHIRRTGLVKRSTDARNNLIDYQLQDYDVLGRLTKVRDRMDSLVTAGNYTLRVYNDEGNLTIVTDASGKSTGYDYDDLGRKTMTTYPDGKQEIVDYDELGRMKSVLWLGSLGIGSEETSTDPTDGLQRDYLYEYSGVVKEITFTNNRPPQPISNKHLFGYDEFLRRTSSQNEIDNVSQIFTYNDRGQLKTEELDFDTSTSNDLLVTTYVYDDPGRLESISYPDSDHSVNYTYTQRNQPETISWDTGTPDQLESREYDGAGRLTNIDRDHFDEVRNYDTANRLLGIANQDAGSSGQIGDLSYSYDDNGNKQSETWSNGPTGMSAWDFDTVSTGSGDYLNGYDEEDRLRRFNRDGTDTPAAAISTAYMDRGGSAGNTIGNIASITDGANTAFDGNRSYSDLYELTSIGNTPLTQVFNLDGQVETMHNGNGLVEWDAAGRLKQVNVNDGTDDYQYGYDCDGRRVWKKKLGASMTFTVYCHGGPNVISEFTVNPATSAASLDKEYVYGTTIDELLLIDLPITTARVQSEKLGVTRNQQWSIMSVYDHVTGSIVGRFNYDIFGMRFVLDANGSYATNQDQDFEVPYGYTSRRHDPESGLMYFRARYYDPTTGEFISRDPWGYVNGYSLYRGYMVPNGADPSGLVVKKFRVTAKSFINGVSPIGKISPDRWGLGPFPFSGGVLTPGHALASATARLKFAARNIFQHLAPFNENPQTDAKDGKYRLFTRVTVTADCCNGKLTVLSLATDMDGGREGPGIYGTINFSPFFKSKIPGGMHYLWRGWGRPNRLAEPGMQWIAWRRSFHIWHYPGFALTCNGNVPVVSRAALKGGITGGSRYPSHRMWVNGRRVDNKRQRFLSDLWYEHAAWPTFVK